MQELVGRITAFDPDASESLKVVAYFDELIAGGVGLRSILRGAAFLTDSVAAAELNGRITRMVTSGDAPAPQPGRIEQDRAVDSGRVWLELSGEPRIHDVMVLERAAFAVSILLDRKKATSENPVAVVIDQGHHLEERVAALERLRIDPAQRVRLVAFAAHINVADAPSVIHPTPWGLFRVAIDLTSDIRVGRAGIGIWTRADQLPHSLPSAIAAVRLVSDTHPVVDATDLGDVLDLAIHAPRDDTARLDVKAVTRLSARQRQLADALVENDSLRSAAATVNLHHSTVRIHHTAIIEQLGWDPRTPIGRTRYTLARIRLALDDE